MNSSSGGQTVCCFLHPGLQCKICYQKVLKWDCICPTFLPGSQLTLFPAIYVPKCPEQMTSNWAEKHWSALPI